MSAFQIERVRAAFPALTVTEEGRARVYFDGPGGTQVCGRAIEAMAAYLGGGTANAGGPFATSAATDAISAAAHAAMADLLGGAADEIAFGPNMTTLTFAASRALSRDWREGDELVVTRLDHDANVAPWLAVAQDCGMTVRWLDFDPATGTLQLDALPSLLNARTRLVAVGAASNALGTINDVAAIVAMVRQRCDALVFVDAVQSVPHVVTDVAALGCDLLACSPYKFFGPHAGVLWVRRAVAERIEAYKVRPAGMEGAHRFETGTPSFEAQAGVLGTIDYLDELGWAFAPAAATRRERLIAAMERLAACEHALGEHVLRRLPEVAGARLHGPPTMQGRVPTFGFTIEGKHPTAVAAALARENIFVWAGHFYAVEAIARLGLADRGGLIRVGLNHYNTFEEVDRLIDALIRP